VIGIAQCQPMAGTWLLPGEDMKLLSDPSQLSINCFLIGLIGP
jgi:hypothetical protein